jgi:hypothetical protein
MKIGDLVKLRFGSSLPDGVGIIVEKYARIETGDQRAEMRVQWLDDAGKDVSWVMRKDLEVISPASPRTWR